jgi:hypothetical protein
MLSPANSKLAAKLLLLSVSLEKHSKCSLWTLQRMSSEIFPLLEDFLKLKAEIEALIASASASFFVLSMSWGSSLLDEFSCAAVPSLQEHSGSIEKQTDR